MDREQVLKDFPVGCRIVPLNLEEAENMEVSIESVGIVEGNDGEILDVKWENVAWLGSYFARRFKLLGTNVESKKSISNLKKLNTDGRDCCANCGTKLRDPGMGTKYRYCKTCEP